MSHIRKHPARKWYSVIVTVWRNEDGHIVRDSENLLIDGISAENAEYRAWEILLRVHDGENHTILVSNPVHIK